MVSSKTRQEALRLSMKLVATVCCVVQDVARSSQLRIAHKYLPTLEAYLKTPSGLPGWQCTFYTQDAQGNPNKEVAMYVLNTTAIKLNDFLPSGLTPNWTIKLEGKLTVDTTAIYEFDLAVAGRAKLWVDGELTIDNWTHQTPGDYFYGYHIHLSLLHIHSYPRSHRQGTVEEKADVRLEEGQPVDVLVEYTNTIPPDTTSDGTDKGNSQPGLMRGVVRLFCERFGAYLQVGQRLGGIEKIDPDQAIQKAVALATRSDVVIYIGGLTPEWESEGFDRPTLYMPGRQDELISKLGKANPNTVVCIQAVRSILMARRLSAECTKSRVPQLRCHG